MKEENKVVIFSLLIIALAAMGLAGWFVFKNTQDAPLTALIMIPSSVVSGMIGYLTKGIVNTLRKDDNTPEG